MECICYVLQIIYEHCLHLKMKQEVMRDNFKVTVGKLSKMFDMGSESGPEILDILKNLYEEITPKLLISVDKNITPPIDVRDVSKVLTNTSALNINK